MAFYSFLLLLSLLYYFNIFAIIYFVKNQQRGYSSSEASSNYSHLINLQPLYIILLHFTFVILVLFYLLNKEISQILERGNVLRLEFMIMILLLIINSF